MPCLVAEDLTPEQVKAFRLADNKVSELAEWDIEKLETELAELAEIGFEMDDFGFNEMLIDSKYTGFDQEEPQQGKGSLVDKFIVPPFSVFDTRQGYWANRKRLWLEKTGNLSETRDSEFGKIGGNKNDNMMSLINDGTSNFDPVLAEIMCKWFCVEGGKILDPFGGEQTKGVVAGELGFKYKGVEIRQEQVDLNRSKTEKFSDVKYICGDSNDISKLIKERDFDFCFTSPPYYDLEIYSKDDMSALGTYEEFMKFYKNIFAQCFEMLKPDSFLAIKVGEIRNKKTSEYRAFVADNVKLFQELGFYFYNDIVLVTPVGTAQLRASQSMATRKICKTHQNILVFYKGNLKNIKEKFLPLDFSGIEENENANDEL